MPALIAKEAESELNLGPSIGSRLVCRSREFETGGSLKEALDETLKKSFLQLNYQELRSKANLLSMC